MKKDLLNIFLCCIIIYLSILLGYLLYKGVKFIDKKFLTPKTPLSQIELKLINQEQRIRYLERLLIKKGGKQWKK